MSVSSNFNTLIKGLEEISLRDLSTELQSLENRTRIIGELILHKEHLANHRNLFFKLFTAVPIQALGETEVKTLFTFWYRQPNSSTAFLHSIFNSMSVSRNYEMINHSLTVIPEDQRSVFIYSLTLLAETTRNLEIVLYLNRMSSDIPVTDDYGNTHVHIAVVNNYEKLLSFLLRAQPDLTLINNLGETPLHSACRSVYSELTPQLINSAVLEAQDFEGNTPIIAAAKENNSALFAQLFNRRANLQACNHKGLTAIHYLFLNKNNQLLISLSLANPFSRDLERRLKAASFNELTLNEQYLLLPQKEPDEIHTFLSSLSEERKNALRAESIRIRAGSILFFFANFAEAMNYIKSTNQENSEFGRVIINKIDPIILALAAEEESQRHFLMNFFHRMDENHQKVFVPALPIDDFNRMIRSFSVAEQEHAYQLASSDQFSAMPDDVMDIDTGFTPLHHAAASDDRADTENLLSMSREGLNAQDSAGRTPLNISCINNATDSFDVLMENAPDVNLCDTNRNSPLMAACINGNLHMVRELVAKGANPSLLNNKNLSALHYALSNEREECVNYLIQHSEYCRELGTRIDTIPYTDLSLEERTEFWHLQSPEYIHSGISSAQLSLKERVLNEEISLNQGNVEAEYDSFHHAINVIKTHYFPIINWNDPDSEELYELRILITNIAPRTVACALINEDYKNTLLQCVPLMTGRQIKIFIPQLSDEDFFQVTHKLQGTEKAAVLKAGRLTQVRHWLKEGGFVAEYLKTSQSLFALLPSLNTDEEKKAWIEKYHHLGLPRTLGMEREKIKQLRAFLNHERFLRMTKNIDQVHDDALKLCTEIEEFNREHARIIEALNEQFKEEVPDELKDHVSLEIMSDPVELPDGTVVDRSTLFLIDSNQMINPFNRQALTEDQLKPRLDLLAEINTWKVNHPES